MKKQKTIIFSSLIFVSSISIAQIQIGNDIDGEAANNSSGWSVSMPDGMTIAIGAPSNDDVASGAGHVRIYEKNGSTWTQKGTDLDGRTSFEQKGYDVSMPNPNTIAIGVPGPALSYGRIEVHTWNGSAWVQKGGDIVGLSIGQRFGYTVCMPDENTVAIGTQGGASATDNTEGRAYVYTWNGTTWVQKGNAIVGEVSNDRFGYDVTMPDANTIAVSSPFNDASGTDAGHVRVYNWDGTDWIQVGADIDGVAAGDNSGWAIDMPDAMTIAISAPAADGNGLFNSGHVRVFSWNGSTWQQKGNDINGEKIGDASGYSLSMIDANTFVAGSRYNNDSFTNAGCARVYAWSGTTWNKIGNTITGEAQDDESGFSVGMGDATTVAVGSIRNKGNGNDAGHVRIYDVSGTTGLNENTLTILPTVFPNPTNGRVKINLGKKTNKVQITVRNVFGQQIYDNNYASTQYINLTLDYPTGIYFIEVLSENNKSVIKVIKE